MEVHGKVCMEDFPNVTGCYIPVRLKISGVTPNSKHWKLISAHNAIFYSCSEFKNDIFYSVLQYIGPAAVAAKYKYKLAFDNKVCEERLTVTLLARSLDEDLNEVHNSGNCVKLYPEHYSRFANDGNELTFTLHICIVGLGRPRRRWEDNIKMDVQEVGRARGDWMELAQDRDGWRTLVSTVKNRRVP
jgi:hypothetical protein